MYKYEFVAIARQELSQGQAEELKDQVAAIVKENGGHVAYSEYCGLINLAYSIKKNSRGHFFLMQIDAPYAAMQELERKVKINEDIIRHLVTRVKEHGPRPSMLSGYTNKHHSRDDRYYDSGSQEAKA